MAKNKSACKTKYNAQKISAEPKQDNIIHIDKSSRPTWKFEQIVTSGDFSLEACKELHIKQIIAKLKDFEGLTWQQIEQATHDRTNKSRHHALSLDKLTDKGIDAYKRKFLPQVQPTEIFSLALDNLKRLIGFREGSSFYVVWIDIEHKFVQTKKR